jgi:hypothetical protein
MKTREPSDEERRQWRAEFEAAAKRTLEERIRYGFIKTYRPVMDDAPFRAFDTMEEYRQWCEANLPKWMGYDRVKDEPSDDCSGQST